MSIFSHLIAEHIKSAAESVSETTCQIDNDSNSSQSVNETTSQIDNGSTVIYNDLSQKFREKTMKKVIVKEPITKIFDDSFGECKKLEEIEILNSITSIGKNAFWNCESLKYIILPDSVTSIGDHAFWNCKSLKYITLPDSVTSIGSFTFFNCESLEKIRLSNSITSISTATFNNCTSLKEVEIPDSVTIIEDSAFEGCSNLEKVIIPDSIKSIGVWAFKDCNKARIYYNNKEYNALNFNKGNKEVIYYGNKSFVNSLINKVIVDQSVTSIKDEAFRRCSLEEIIIPNTVISIGYYAFDQCYNLKKIELPNSVRNIEEGAFCKCTNLKEVKISNAVTELKEHVFSQCKNLEKVVIPKSVTKIDDLLFILSKKVCIYCSKGSYAEKYAIEHHLKYKYIEDDEQDTNSKNLKQTDEFYKFKDLIDKLGQEFKRYNNNPYSPERIPLSGGEYILQYAYKAIDPYDARVKYDTIAFRMQYDKNDNCISKVVRTWTLNDDVRTFGYYEDKAIRFGVTKNIIEDITFKTTYLEMYIEKLEYLLDNFWTFYVR